MVDVAPVQPTAPRVYTIHVVADPSLVGARVYAAGFFPQRARLAHKRVIRIGPAFRTMFNKLGCLRHEFGHTLGFGHEDPVLGDYSMSTDQQPTPAVSLAPTSSSSSSSDQSKGDVDSVMSYKKLFGDEENKRVTELSVRDKQECIATYNIADTSDEVYDIAVC